MWGALRSVCLAASACVVAGCSEGPLPPQPCDPGFLDGQWALRGNSYNYVLTVRRNGTGFEGVARAMPNGPISWTLRATGGAGRFMGTQLERTVGAGAPVTVEIDSSGRAGTYRYQVEAFGMSGTVTYGMARLDACPTDSGVVDLGPLCRPEGPDCSRAPTDLNTCCAGLRCEETRGSSRCVRVPCSNAGAACGAASPSGAGCCEGLQCVAGVCAAPPPSCLGFTATDHCAQVTGIVPGAVTAGCDVVIAAGRPGVCRCSSRVVQLGCQHPATTCASVCAEACRSVGADCAGGSQCCSGQCENGRCVCGTRGRTYCNSGGTCCSGRCDAYGLCTFLPTDASCAHDSACASYRCADGRCACRADGEPCSGGDPNAGCCSGGCRLSESTGRWVCGSACVNAGASCARRSDCCRGFCVSGRCQDSCTPRCSTRLCGDDGCGGTCPDMCPGRGAGWRCCNEQLGQCCGPACTPNCTGRACGDNGCSGSCGTCAAGRVCDANGQCVATSACGTCPAGQVCSNGTCVPSSSGPTSDSRAPVGSMCHDERACIEWLTFTYDACGGGPRNVRFHYRNRCAYPVSLTYSGWDGATYDQGLADSNIAPGGGATRIGYGPFLCGITRYCYVVTRPDDPLGCGYISGCTQR